MTENSINDDIPAGFAPSDTTAPAPVTAKDIIAELARMDPAARKELLTVAGIVPTTEMMSPEKIQTIVMTSGAANARAMQLALRKENPTYPERSVFHPSGKFDDDGNALAPKAIFSRETFFNHVRLGGELETEDEINLYNRFTKSTEARDGTWTAVVEMVGGKERLMVEVPTLTNDQRMNLPHDLCLILRELLDGPESVNPAMQERRIKELEDQVRTLVATRAAA